MSHTRNNLDASKNRLIGAFRQEEAGFERVDPRFGLLRRFLSGLDCPSEAGFCVALEIVGKVRHADLDAGPGEADGAHDQAHAVLLASEHVRSGQALGIIPNPIEPDSRREDSHGADFLIQGGKLRRFAMAGAIGWRGDYSSEPTFPRWSPVKNS